MSLQIRNLTKRFGNKTIFENFSYEFESSGIYVITGKSGIGKTTLLRIISGLDKNFDGEVLGGGYSEVSYSFQEHRLFPNLTAFENVMEISFSERSFENERYVREIFQKLGFSHEDMDKTPAELSGGMKQRVSLIRAFSSEKEILLLDEPTKELDDNLKEIILGMISDISARKLVILVTHDVRVLERFRANIIEMK